MSKNIFCFIVIVLSFTSFLSVKAQDNSYWLSSKVHDNFTDAVINNARVFLLNKDSVILDSTQTKWDNFSFRVKKDKYFRSCIIKIVHPDYQTHYSTHSLKYVGQNAYFKLPTIFLKRKNSFTDQILQEVEVVATKVKMFYRGDTLVYNADAFNVANGSMLAALIKQMPGTELTKQGEIYVNGRKVDNLMLNGKDFFRGKNKLMLENLPYYTVKEIKVYDHTTDKAKALNDERAEKDFVMDVGLKKEYSKGYMANVEVGAGTEDAFLARLFGLRFTDVSRLAVVGGMNNLNMSDYSMSGYASDEGGREGRTKSKLLTAELMTEHKRNKNTLTVELSKKKSERGSDVYQETYQDVGSTYSTTQNSYNTKNLGVSLSNKYTLKLPVWLESTTNLRFNSKKEDREERYFESGSDTRQQGLKVLDSLFNMGVAVNDPSMISARKQLINSKSKEYGASQYFSFAKNLYSSDIIDFSAGVDYTKSTNERDRFYSYLTWDSEQTQEDVTEDIDQPNTHFGIKADVSYKFSRLLYSTDLKFFAGYRFNRDKDRETTLDVTSSAIDAENSYNRRMEENSYSVGANYDYLHRNTDRQIQTQIKMNLPLTIVDRNTSYARYTLDTCLTQSPVFFEPSIMFSRKKWNGPNLGSTIWDVNIATSLKYTLPDATQLITLPVTSDRINIYHGNASLKSPALWNSSFTLRLPLKKNSTSEYMAYTLNYTNYFNRIVNTYRYEDGVYTNKPNNVNGTWDLNFNAYGQKYSRASKCPITINYSFKSNYHKMKNFVANGADGQSRQIDNDELYNHLHVQMRSSYKKVSGGFRLSADWRKPLNDRVDMGYSDTWEYKGDLWFGVGLPANIDLSSDGEILKRTGYSNRELNKTTYVWNMSLSTSIFKNKIGLCLKAIDILRQYKSVAYVVNERGICETRSVTLPSYLLFSVTYKLNKQPKKK